VRWPATSFGRTRGTQVVSGAHPPVLTAEPARMPDGPWGCDGIVRTLDTIGRRKSQEMTRGGRQGSLPQNGRVRRRLTVMAGGTRRWHARRDREAALDHDGGHRRPSRRRRSGHERRLVATWSTSSAIPASLDSGPPDRDGLIRWRRRGHRGGAVLPRRPGARASPRDDNRARRHAQRSARWSSPPSWRASPTGWAARCSCRGPWWGPWIAPGRSLLHSQQIFAAGSWREWRRRIRATALGAIAAATSLSVRRGRGPAAPSRRHHGGVRRRVCARPLRLPLPRRGAFVVLAAVYLLAGLICLRFVAHVPPLPITRLSTLLRDVAGPGPFELPPRLGGHVCSHRRLRFNLASLLHHSRSGARAGPPLRHPVGLPGLVSAIAVLVIGIVLWTPWINRLGPARQMRRAVPGAWLFSAALLAANSLPHVALYILLPWPDWASSGWPDSDQPPSPTWPTARRRTGGPVGLMSIYTVTLAAGGAIVPRWVGWRSASRPSTGWWSRVPPLNVTFVLLGRCARSRGLIPRRRRSAGRGRHAASSC